MFYYIGKTTGVTSEEGKKKCLSDSGISLSDFETPPKQLKISEIYTGNPAKDKNSGELKEKHEDLKLVVIKKRNKKIEDNLKKSSIIQKCDSKMKTGRIVKKGESLKEKCALENAEDITVDKDRSEEDNEEFRASNENDSCKNDYQVSDDGQHIRNVVQQKQIRKSNKIKVTENKKL